jgi:hypothetical protein
VNAGVAALRQVNSDIARGKKASLRLRHDKSVNKSKKVFDKTLPA